MLCPKCGFAQPDSRKDCLRCGIIFAKWRPRAQRRPPGSRATSPRPSTGKAEAPGLQDHLGPRGSRRRPSPGPSEEAPDHHENPPIRILSQGEFGDEDELKASPIPREGWMALGLGLVVALILTFVPLLNFIFRPLITLVHELGHATVFWLAGYVAIPSFDFLYGGGVTVNVGDQHMPLVLLLAGLQLYNLFLHRHNKSSVIVFSTLLALYLAFALTRVHLTLMLFPGHGFELLFAGIFLYRGISGWGCVHAVERLGFWVLLHDLGFAHDLMTDPVARMKYREGKGGVLEHDFVRLARYHFRTRLPSVARLFLFFTILTPAITFLAFRYRRFWQRAAVHLLSREQD